MPGRVPLFGVLILAVLSGCLGGGGNQASPALTTATSPGFRLEPIIAGLDAPLYVADAGDGAGRLFVVEQAGKVLIWKDGVLLPTPFLDIQRLVSSGGERGLLSIAFAPDSPRDGRFYVDYTDTQGDTVVARYRVMADDPDRADPATAEVLLHVTQPYPNHNGGLLLFGPDGKLYVGLGDGGSGGDPQGNGQATHALLGKILRLDVSDPRGYAIPRDNPYANGMLGAPEVWASGLRNPWRFSFDRTTHALWIGDVGQNSWEEIDFQPASSHGGENYGWNLYEGNHRYNDGNAMTPVTFPVAEYPTRSPHCAVTGGYVYRGSAIPSLQGRYVFGDYCSGTIWTLDGESGSRTLTQRVATGLHLSSFGEDASGELFAVDLGGGVYQIVPA